jgi:hypothetical protein
MSMPYGAPFFQPPLHPGPVMTPRPGTALEQDADIANPGMYHVASGFALMWDFVAAVPEWVQRCRLVYGLFDSGNANGEALSATTAGMDSLAGGRGAAFTTVGD